LLARFDKIRTLVRAEQPDVVEAHSPYLGAAAVVACGRGAGRVRTAFWHADHVGAYLEPVLGGLARPAWWAVRALLAPFDATFVAGAAQVARLRALGVRNVEHVPLGVDPETFNPGARSDDVRRDLMGTEDAAGGPLLVGTGRFAFEKRWDVVLDAFARLRAEHRGAVLVLFGDGPEAARLARRAGAGVRFHGFEKDRRRLASALASADALVHGCPYETYALGVAEAVACGLPVVVPDRGGAAERADPACSERYTSLDAQACVEAIRRVLGRQPADVRRRAIEAASRVPTLTQHFRRVLSVYDDLLHARCGGSRP
jgi:alpha-1,6-mannosyltransferase